MASNIAFISGKARLAHLAERMSQGESVESITVRDLLSWFGAARRTYKVVKQIRSALQFSELDTIPDFEDEYLDSKIDFERIPWEEPGFENPEPAGRAEDQTVTGAIGPASDPTIRISKLESANLVSAGRKLVAIPPTAELRQAVTKMALHDFSQLPVMTSEREVKGIVSWKSIGLVLATGRTGTLVQEFMHQHVEVRSDASLFDAIPLIVKHQHVLIRAKDNKITGIVTPSDLTLQFQQVTESYLLLGEIENHIRNVIDGANFSTDVLAAARDPGDTEREVVSAADLSFGEYIRLLQNEANWGTIRLGLDRLLFCGQLDAVRRIRNDVMHFDPDPLGDEDLQTLRNLVLAFQNLAQLD